MPDEDKISGGVMMMASRENNLYIYILLTKHQGRTGRMSARGLDKKDRGPIFSQYGLEQDWLIRGLMDGFLDVSKAL